MLKRIFAAAFAIALCGAATAQQYPTKPITMLVPYAAAGRPTPLRA
jgi:tripartite-type tricarboxylate transporter receptor subunit TctC